jgi:hypothetical protein
VDDQGIVLPFPVREREFVVSKESRFAQEPTQSPLQHIFWALSKWGKCGWNVKLAIPFHLLPR